MAGAEGGARSEAVPPIILVEDGHQAAAPTCEAPRDAVRFAEDSNGRGELGDHRHIMVDATRDLVKSESQGRTLHHDANGRRLLRGQHKDESRPDSSMSYTDHDCAEPLVGRQPKPKTRVQPVGYNGQAQKPECPFFLGYEQGVLCVAGLAPLNDVARLGTIISTPVTTNGFTPFFLWVASAQDQAADGSIQASLRGTTSRRPGDAMALTGDLGRADPRRDAFLTSRGIFVTACADTISTGGKQVYAYTPPAPTPQP